MLLKSQVCDFGWPAPDFDLATPHGAHHTRHGIMGPKGMLIAFICNHCPYVIALIDRLAKDMDTLDALQSCQMTTLNIPLMPPTRWWILPRCMG
ncbi:thioredoxin domain-containing protein [Sulfitobacter sediminilitoris]|uniref:hypothetical protein n=1 Tax=Sulfitobacter sediminilitoris TaxID=2698830 RepID=UPI002E27B9B5|nr:hypothetical protein [Sulfitobacter sediminilitoris]